MTNTNTVKEVIAHEILTMPGKSGDGQYMKISLPTYLFNRSHYWIDFEYRKAFEK